MPPPRLACDRTKVAFDPCGPEQGIAEVRAVVAAIQHANAAITESTPALVVAGVVEIALAHRTARSGVAHKVVPPVEVLTSFAIKQPFPTDGVKCGGSLTI